MKTVSLHTRLLFATLIPVTLFVILFGIFTVMLRFQDIDDLQMRNAEVLVEKYRTEAMGSAGQGQWREMTQSALESPYIRSISILDKDRQVVAHGGPLLKTVFESLPTKTGFQTYPAPDGANYLLALSPFSYGSANYWLAIELRPAPFTIARYQSAIITSFSAFIMLFVLALILASTLRKWLEPISRMSRQITQMTPENLEQRLDCQAEGDLAGLQDDINALLERVTASVAELRQDIEQTRADLEENYQTIEAQNIELRLSRAQAIEGNRIKSAFLANISHELRTPLNSINGFSRLLLKSPLQGRQADFVETIQKSANNLLAIINDVLDFSKIEAGKLQLERQPLSIEDTVFDVLNMLSPQADDKGLEQIAFIYDDVPHMMEGDSLRLKQVLTNLVSNAIKFTPAGEVVVRVMLEDTRPLHHVIKISVTDTGIGLTRTAKADLFQAFQQGDPSVSRQFGGTGLGLVIAKNLVGLMEGQIGFDETQEVGATFWFDFKACIVESKPQEAVLLANKKLLILEPHEKCRQLLSGALSRAQAQVIAATDWEGLLEALKTPCDGAVISSRFFDESTPSRLQALRACYSGPIVVLTRGYDNQPEPHFVSQYRLHCLSKPLRPRVLLALLAQCFSMAKLNDPSPWIQAAPVTVKPVPLRIMAVDDHPANLKLVCTLLEDMGIEVLGVSSGQEAVQRALAGHFDLIFMDIQMPGMSGIDATRTIRDNERDGKRVPIVALTAHALSDERDHMLREGMNDYLTKPLQEEQLIHIIQKWTGVMLQESGWMPAVTPEQKLASAVLVDWNESLHLAAGKADLARDMLDMLLGSLPAQQEKMEAAIHQANAAALLAHTHYLHGATRYCGVPSLRTAACRLEERLKDALKHQPEKAIEAASPDIEALLGIMAELQDWQDNTTLPM
ncbi:MAG: response regulator [Fluviicoccus sp.]|uniref:response regulator n=1 Tax=Fluviicoccus sp. TaxID=2003552 RepID=UPI00271F4491|nr:response regulator [Fluviicoccus sp.]MDO8329045.1 response regulator [Fluviicoccus sp.]